MQFRLWLSAANAPSRLLSCLDDLLSRVGEGVHELVFEDIVTIEESDWFRTMRRHNQDLVRLLCEASVWNRSVQPSCIEICEPSDIQGARDAAMTPLTILVENDATDGALVEATVLAFGDAPLRKRWEDGRNAVPRGWEFEHGGGGGEIPRKIQEVGARRLPGGPRLIVVCDSDRLEPAGTVPDKYWKEAQIVGGIPVVVLFCREAENYLPDAFWRAWLEADRGRTSYQALIHALLRLSPEQRDFIDMEGDKRLIDENSLGPLFDGSDLKNPRPSVNDLATFRGRPRDLKGGGKEKATGERRKTILQLPAYVQEGKVTRLDLEERDRDGILKKLVELIREAL